VCGLEIRCASDEEEKGLRANNIPGELCGRGREGARTPISHAASQNAPLCLDLGRIGLCATRDLMISKPQAYSSTWKLQAD
jgi:hypothetical protein